MTEAAQDYKLQRFPTGFTITFLVVTLTLILFSGVVPTGAIAWMVIGAILIGFGLQTELLKYAAAKRPKQTEPVDTGPRRAMLATWLLGLGIAVLAALTVATHIGDQSGIGVLLNALVISWVCLLLFPFPVTLVVGTIFAFVAALEGAAGAALTWLVAPFFIGLLGASMRGNPEPDNDDDLDFLGYTFLVMALVALVLGLLHAGQNVGLLHFEGTGIGGLPSPVDLGRFVGASAIILVALRGLGRWGRNAAVARRWNLEAPGELLDASAQVCVATIALAIESHLAIAWAAKSATSGATLGTMVLLIIGRVGPAIPAALLIALVLRRSELAWGVGRLAMYLATVLGVAMWLCAMLLDLEPRLGILDATRSDAVQNVVPLAVIGTFVLLGTLLLKQNPSKATQDLAATPDR